MKAQALKTRKIGTKDIVICGILMALTTVMTIVVQIPVVGSHGYVNMGDTVVLFSAMYLGRKNSAIIGGFGSALADILTGYGAFAPLTFITKGLEGFICGLISEKFPTKVGRILSSVIGGAIMVSGYFIGEIFMYGIKSSMAAVPANSIQAIFAIVTSLLIYSSVKKGLGKPNK
ncbi:ECF transporter S component [Peptostreptococcus faecalis]|uniref:ECF transporter S component n=1 Tax=Peptostreptococcus faecalis TaxID=2045015 RepID=UPI000C7C7C9B|nr:ECF transporter S component [Peptostreptococcus faecalis]